MTEPDDDRARILAARLRLRDRFLGRPGQTRASADAAPLGSGPLNRHGMPQLPVGQTATAPGKWPVLDLGARPDVPLDRWLLVVGEYASIAATVAADGRVTAQRLQVSKDGVRPPQ